MVTVQRRLAALRGGWAPEDYTRKVRVAEGSVLVLSDAHIPYHSERALAKALETARDWEVEAIVWLGDLLDLPTFSPWGTTDMTARFSRELSIARGVIELAGQYVKRQYWSQGNHEERLLRKNGYQFGLEQLAGMAGLGGMLADGSLVVSDNPTLEYGKDWLLFHPKQYGSVPLVVPGKLADLNQKNILSAHAHHWGMGTSPSGKYTVVESGGLFDPRFHRYVQWQVTAHRQWVTGFALLGYDDPMLFRA